MHRVNLDCAPAAVQEFLRQLPLDDEGVELESAGRVVLRVTAPQQMTTADRQSLISRGRELVRAARARNQGVSSRVIEREVRHAVDEVRRKHE